MVYRTNGNIVFRPKQEKNEVNETIIVTKDKIIINGVEVEPIDLEAFISSNVSEESAEKFVRGIFKLFKKEIMKDYKLMTMFQEVFGKTK